jgi:hypothetical protein
MRPKAFLRCPVARPSVLVQGADRRATSLPEVSCPSDEYMTEALLPGASLLAVPKVALRPAFLRSPELPLTSLNTQGSLASGWKRLVQPAPCGVACFAPFCSAAHLPLSLAKSFPPWRRPWGFPLQSLFTL